jgi:hypothetical protein
MSCFNLGSNEAFVFGFSGNVEFFHQCKVGGFNTPMLFTLTGYPTEFMINIRGPEAAQGERRRFYTYLVVAVSKNKRTAV